jgi:hypothetical protein
MEKRLAALQGLLNERDQQVDEAVGLLRNAGRVFGAQGYRKCASEIDAFLSNSETKEPDSRVNAVEFGSLQYMTRGEEHD